MLVDINKAKQFFSEYVKNYDYKDPQVQLKIKHIERVTKVARELAITLGLDDEDVELAELIGLLHDIGRFEQIKNFHTFIDKDSINHGEYGAKVLFEDGLIRNFIKSSEFDGLIKKAILNHNRSAIEPGLTDRELLHAKLIRDADKTDIYYVWTVEDISSIFRKDDISDEVLSDTIYKQFIEEKAINYADIRSGVDLVVANFAYVYDFYFKPSMTIIKNKNYLEIFYNRLKFNDPLTKKRMDEIYNLSKSYIEKNG